MASEIRAQPGLLRRSLVATTQRFIVAVGIQSDDVPTAEIVAVITFSRFSRLGSPILKVAHGFGAVVFVVSRRRPRSIPESSPSALIAGLKLLQGAGFVGQISGGKDRAGDFVDQLGGGFCAGAVGTTGNVTGTHEDERVGRQLWGVCGTFLGRRLGGLLHR